MALWRRPGDALGTLRDGSGPLLVHTKIAMICKNENVPYYCTDFDFLGGDNQRVRFCIGMLKVLDEKVPQYCTEFDFLGGGKQQQQRTTLGGSAFRARVATT